MSSGGRRELASGDRRPLRPLNGRCEAPDRKRMIIRSTDGAARSVRAIAVLSCKTGLKRKRRIGTVPE